MFVNNQAEIDARNVQMHQMSMGGGAQLPMGMNMGMGLGMGFGNGAMNGNLVLAGNCMTI
jgi:hypothetical protein